LAASTLGAYLAHTAWQAVYLRWHLNRLKRQTYAALAR
jgi:hypothetical protein